MLTLTPAYDICPQGRTGNEASQAMLISGNNRMSQLAVCIKAANAFLISEEEAESIIENQINVIGENWLALCDTAMLSDVDRKVLWGRAILNPFAFQNLEGDKAYLADLADQFRTDVLL